MTEYVSIYLGQVNKRSALTYVVHNDKVRVWGHIPYVPDPNSGIVKYADIIKSITGLIIEHTSQRRPPVRNVPVLVSEFNIGQPILDCFKNSVSEKTREQVHMLTITNEQSVRKDAGRLYVPLKDMISALIVSHQKDKLVISKDGSKIEIDIEGFLKQLPGFYTELYSNPKEPEKYLEFFDKSDFADVLSIAASCWYIQNEETKAE